MDSKADNVTMELEEKLLEEGYKREKKFVF